MKRIIAVALSLTAVTAVFAAEPKLADDKAKSSYSFGYQIGNNLKARTQDMDPASFSRGVQDGLTGAKPALSDQERNDAMTAYQDKMMKKQQTTVEEAKKRGETYLADNKKKSDVKTLGSGVQYKVVKEGSGKSPKPTDTVSVNYKGTLVNGTEFDSSYKRGQPATFPVNGVIKGWQEVLPLMKEGAKWEVVIPPDMAYGDRGAGGAIGPGETLLFDIELLKIQ